MKSPGSRRPSHLPDLALLHLDVAPAGPGTWGEEGWHRRKAEPRRLRTARGTNENHAKMLEDAGKYWKIIENAGKIGDIGVVLFESRRSHALIAR